MTPRHSPGDAERTLVGESGVEGQQLGVAPECGDTHANLSRRAVPTPARGRVAGWMMLSVWTEPASAPGKGTRKVG
ncbi:hypothetical protein ABZY44_17545 [Streptomyces sp. NPDC006544]|uniref:hypothetical protein n=1 Tax=Streptomyces sp. NPDC006544 TaxID=3154583 RepID=UPI0033A5AB4F